MIDDPAALDAVLDRVPLARLKEAVARREAIISGADMEQFDQLLRHVCHVRRIARERLLSSEKDAQAVSSRWWLYACLHDAGWTVGKIHGATGHDRSRILHGLRKHKRLPPAPRHLLAS